MNPLFSNYLTLFGQPEGKILFQFILILLISGGLFAVIAYRKMTAAASYRRAIASIVIVLFLHILFFTGLFINFLKILSLNEYLSSFSSFLFSFSALWFIWLWCFPAAEQKSDGPKYVLSSALVLILFFQIFFTVVIKIINFEILHYLNILWLLITLIILAAGLIILIINHNSSWLGGLVYIVFQMLGLIASQTIHIPEIQHSSLLLFAQIIAYLTLPTISQGLVFSETSPEEKQPIYYLPIANQNMAIMPNQEIFKSWLSLAVKNQDILIADEFLKNLARVFHADHAFLITPVKHQDEVEIYAGFSSWKKRLSFPIHLGNTYNQTIKSKLQKNKSFTLTAEDYYSQDLLNLLKLINIQQPAHILFFPLRTSNQHKKTFGVLLISSSHIRWNKNQENYLRGVKDELVQILQIIFPNKGTLTHKKASEVQPSQNKDDALFKISIDETPQQKVERLESELKLALEEYARIKRLFEEKSSKINPWKNAD